MTERSILVAVARADLILTAARAWIGVLVAAVAWAAVRGGKP